MDPKKADDGTTRTNNNKISHIFQQVDMAFLFTDLSQKFELQKDQKLRRKRISFDLIRIIWWIPNQIDYENGIPEILNLTEIILYKLFNLY